MKHDGGVVGEHDVHGHQAVGKCLHGPAPPRIGLPVRVEKSVPVTAQRPDRLLLPQLHAAVRPHLHAALGPQPWQVIRGRHNGTSEHQGGSVVHRRILVKPPGKEPGDLVVLCKCLRHLQLLFTDLIIFPADSGVLEQVLPVIQNLHAGVKRQGQALVPHPVIVVAQAGGEIPHDLPQPSLFLRQRRKQRFPQLRHPGHVQADQIVRRGLGAHFDRPVQLVVARLHQPDRYPGLFRKLGQQLFQRLAGGAGKHEQLQVLRLGADLHRTVVKPVIFQAQQRFIRCPRLQSPDVFPDAAAAEPVIQLIRDRAGKWSELLARNRIDLRQGGLAPVGGRGR